MQIYIFKKIRKKNSLCGSILQSLFQIFKNWLKCISALTAYVWGAAPCSALPTADENAVTESAVTLSQTARAGTTSNRTASARRSVTAI